MGNRGTTPDWDDEQIAKYGLVMHLSSINRGIRMRAQIREQLTQKRKELIEVLNKILDTRQTR